MPARPVLLDMTRLVSRVGAGPLTGIDRVERALLQGLLAREVELHGLCRTAGGFALLSRDGLQELSRRLSGSDSWGPPDMAARLSFRLSAPRRAAESDVRRGATGRAGSSGLASLLRQRLGPGTLYLNVGHSNLSDTVLKAVRAIPSATIAVMIHDVIPLRLPHTQRRGASARFSDKLAAVARFADVVLCPSAAESRDVAGALAVRGRLPPIVVAPPGLDSVVPDPRFVRPARPYFVAVGTIEPRKNLGLLLDVWEEMAATSGGETLPGLHLVGRRGWESARFFRRLDALKSRLPVIEEHSDLSDETRSALVGGALALLHPSFAEGYGFPPLEALALGVRPVCAPLPVYEETMGDAAVYAPGMDLYHWAGVVSEIAAAGAAQTVRSTWKAPTWDSFVNSALATCR